MKVELSGEQVQAITRALAEPRRFAIFSQIAGSKRPMLCSALEGRDAIAPATLSHHLRELQEAGLITMRREGRVAHLSAARPVWKAYVKRLANLI